MKKSSKSRLAIAATAGAMLAACGTAQAQTVLFDSGRPTTLQVIASLASNYIGLSSGEPLTATSTQRWLAAPFSLAANSTVTEIDVDGFVPAGNEFSEFGWAIWRRTGIAVPGTADEVVRAGVGGVAYIPLVAGIQDPRIPAPNGAAFLFKLPVPGAGVALTAGDYYVSVWGHTATGTAGFPNFAWFCNAQKDDTVCPPGTPIVINDGAVHGWRSVSYPAPGFVNYTGLNGVYQADPNAPYGPQPQDPQYFYNTSFQIVGTGSAFQGACCLATGGCQMKTAADCCAGGGLYKGNGIACLGAGCPLVGACCKDDGTCLETTQASCTSAANLGEYGGDNSHCPALGGPACPTLGACCLENGTCILGYQLHCTSQGGLYRGNGITCASAGGACAPFGIVGDDINSADVGDTLATATPVTGYGEALNKIHGTIGLGDRADIYKIKICKRDGFSATTVGSGNALDTELALFDSTGKGISFDDDTGTTVAPITQTNSQALVTGQLIPVANTQTTFYLAVSEFNNTTGIAAPSLPLDAAGVAIFTEPSPWSAAVPPTGGAGWPEWSPNGTSGTQVLNNSGVGPAWSVDPDTLGDYTITLTGACFLGCYANCDQSTASPLLTSNDFQCFLNSFAGQGAPTGRGYGYANCDGSVAQPILNANDFQCFLNAYAAGCNT